MTSRFIVSAASIKLTPLDFEGNRRNIITVIEQERRAGTSLICFPELCISGYGCEDAFFFPHVIDLALRSLEEIIEATQDIAVVVGLPLIFKNTLYNCAALIHNKELLAVVPKQHLANNGIHYETRWFSAWTREKKDFIEINNQKIPFGDIVVSLEDQVIGFEICEDAWVEDRPARTLKERSVTIIVNPSASHFSLRKYLIRLNLIRTGSKISNAVYVYANQLGNEAGRAIYDGDGLIAENGLIVAATKRFSFNQFQVCRYELNSLKDKNSSKEIISYQASEEEQFEEFTRAASLGLFDYLKKSGSKNFVLSLSGGADSTAVLLLVSAMVHFGIEELGFENFKNNLDSVFYSACKNERELLEKLIICVYQGTEQNSEVTSSAAKQVATQVGASFFTICVDDLVSNYKSKIESLIGRELTWESDDIALQNIQSRVRSPGIWFLANIVSGLLLTTGNRSEASVGYSTMDGDSSGSLAPIAGVSKYYIKQWLLYMQTKGVPSFGPFPWLSCITEQSPTAELRPLSQNQTDEADLMPYAVLNCFEQQYLRDKKNPKEVKINVSLLFQSEYSEEQISLWFDKFLRLWKSSQWKRERIAPSFHLDDFSVDSRTWMRYPILSK
jgi:NAD+ synthase (glutamine-hydrolysing)